MVVEKMKTVSRVTLDFIGALLPAVSGAAFSIAGWFAMHGESGARTPVEMSGVPEWLGIALGLFFFIAGVALLLVGLYSLYATTRKWIRRRQFPLEPWNYERPWKHEGETYSPLVTASAMFAGCVWFSLFLVILHWGFVDKPPKDIGGLLLLSAIMLVVDLAFVAFFIESVKHALRARAFGSSSLRFGQFPFFVGEPMRARLRIERPGAFRTMTVTLQCVQGVKVKQIAYEDTLSIEPGALVDGEIPIEFAIPASAGAPDGAWRLDVRAERPALDYRARFDLPVYKRSG